MSALWDQIVSFLSNLYGE